MITRRSKALELVDAIYASHDQGVRVTWRIADILPPRNWLTLRQAGKLFVS